MPYFSYKENIMPGKMQEEAKKNLEKGKERKKVELIINYILNYIYFLILIYYFYN